MNFMQFKDDFLGNSLQVKIQHFKFKISWFQHRVHIIMWFVWSCMIVKNEGNSPQRRFAIWRRLSLAFPVVCCTWTINTPRAPSGRSGTHAHSSELLFENYFIKDKTRWRWRSKSRPCRRWWEASKTSMTRRRSLRRWNKLLQGFCKISRLKTGWGELQQNNFLHFFSSKFYLKWFDTDLWLLALWQGGFWDERLLLWGENLFSSSRSFLSWRFNSRDTFVLILDNRAMLELKYVISITNSASGRKTCPMQIMLAWSIVCLRGNIAHFVRTLYIL